MIRRALPRAARAGFLMFVAAALVSTALPGEAVAEDGPPEEEESEGLSEEERAELYGRKGPYVGFSGLAMFPKSETLNGGVEVQNDVAGGFNLRLGIRVAARFALEAMYEQFYGPVVTKATDSDRGKGYFWSLNAKLYAMTEKMISKPWQPYALVGGGLVSIQPRLANRRSGFGMRFAAGLDYHITPKIILNTEAGYNLGLGTQVENFGYGVVSGGLTYRF